MPTDNFPNTAWPTDIDATQDRTDAVDFVVEEDFDYSDEQIRTIQEWLGSTTTGRIIGDDGDTSHGPSGLVSPVADGASAVALTLLAHDDFATAGGKLLSLGDDYGAAPPAYTEKFAIDQQGILELNPLGALGAAGTQGRVAYNATDDSLYRDDGVSWDQIGSGGLRDVADVIVGNTANGDVVDSTCDVIDATDNGAAMKTAIEAASSGDIVYIRPGSYDFRTGGGPSARISVPAGVTVVGAGMGAVTIITNDSGAGHDGRAFLLGAGARLMDLQVQASEPTAPQAGFGGIIEFGNDAECRRVEVVFANSGWSGIGAPQAFWSTITSAFHMAGTGVKKLIDCHGTSVYRANDVSGPQPVETVSATAGSLNIVERFVTDGGDRCVAASAPIFLRAASLTSPSLIAIRLTTGADSSTIRDNKVSCVEASATNYAIELDTVDRCVVQGNYLIQTTGATGNYAINLRSITNCIISGNVGNGTAAAPGGWEDIANVAVSSSDSLITNNRFGGGAGVDIDFTTCTDIRVIFNDGPRTVLVSIETGRYDYTLVGAAPGVEEVVGQFMFDASKSGGDIRLRCMMNPTFAAAGGCNVHVDDIGAPGAPAAPTRVTGSGASAYKLEALASGQDYHETAVYDRHATTPSVGVLVDGPRMYEVVVSITAGTSGDTVDLGFAGLYVEI